MEQHDPLDGNTFLDIPAFFRILLTSRFVLLTYLFIYSMEQSHSWEANGYSARQEIPRILWNPNVHYSFEKNPRLVRIWNQTNSVHCIPNI